MNRTSEARTTGLSIHERISKKGLEFIKKHDPILYADVQKLRITNKRKRRNTGK